MRILIVEDEPILNARLRDWLLGEGYRVECAHDGEQGLYLAKESGFDAAVIDLGLPKLPGIDIIRTLRQEGNNMPILVLTARDRWQDKVEGLEAGADDYLTKPFEPPEMLARIKALLRRATGSPSLDMVFGALKLDLSGQKVSVSDQELDLTAFEYRLIEYLVRHRDRVVTKQELNNYLYPVNDDPDSNVIEVLIGRLRKKLDPQGDLQPIETLRGRGYRFALSQA
ncbi:response regulator transcription factor [Leeia sp. TBRC 13508]|uniref:Response regulator transcription factor n=1 Tax=Leeia speluncae TaxID=2884804 RepID=A0ABS8DAK0_9NEIS|nr:response regulator transcription factor [Leeia speluncae]MCB6185194.1 response regulator transcription factor [Leeia speluncae]